MTGRSEETRRSRRYGWVCTTHVIENSVSLAPFRLERLGVLQSLKDLLPESLSSVARRSLTQKLAIVLLPAPTFVGLFLTSCGLCAPACAQSRAFVRADKVYLRSKPSTNSEPKALLEEGRTARVVERKGDWVRLKLASGTEGWVREDMLALSKSLAAKRAAILAQRAAAVKRVRLAEQAEAQKKKAALTAKVAAKPDSALVADSPSSDQDDIAIQKQFEAQLSSVVAGVLRGLKAPQPPKAAEPIRTPVEADPRYASAPVASSITLDLETARTENAAPLAGTTTAAPVAGNAGPNVAGTPLNRESTRSERIRGTALAYRGAPYRFGASGTSGRSFDCSSFVQFIYNKNGVGLPRTASEQFRRGTPVRRDELKMGDLVFFKNTYKQGISHVGVYVGDGYFVHASSGAHQVTVSHLDGTYYRNHWAGARRPVE